ncbi:uncharacterized protein FIBRA_03742 [Fibroporia radiculosa]|uniref:Uncharacterized protein n=1 Tax=Fibroporia radiculosa TaxID=599839 RepID=J4G692_9APHY|nr:uncharacterized protein FIBRA_03742 [Fibroporia radiculosa]CCM01678.1 predicted protein [Fibroporia radiculosa]
MTAIFPLTEWTKTNLSAIYSATTQDDFTSAFNQFIADDAHITVNGKHITREKYQQLLEGQKALQKSASVTYAGAVGVPKEKDNSLGLAGNVGVFYTATIIETVDILGVPATRVVTSSLNLTTVQVGTTNNRVASVLNQVVSTEEGPVDPRIPAAK